MNKMTHQDWLLLVLLSLVWGGSFLLARVAVQEIPPLTLVFLRVALAAITLNLVLPFLRIGKAVHSVGLWRDFAMMGLLNNIIPFSLIFYGQQEIGAGLAAIVNAMTPIWTVLIAHHFTSDERLSVNKMTGVMLGFTGVAVLIGTAALTGLSGAVLAQVAVLGATISYGLAGVFGRRFAGVPPVETARGQLTMSAIIMLVVAAFADKLWTLPMPSATAMGSVITLAIVCTAFAYILFFRILARAGATNIALVTFLVPVWAIIFGIVLLGEQFFARHIAGMILILAGLLLIDGRLFQWRRFSSKEP